MRILTLPYRLWWVTLTIALIFNWLLHTGVNIGPRWEDNWAETEPKIEAKIIEMGPSYFYHTLEDGTLEVNKTSGMDNATGWQRLRYK